jgi:hypothetical protein
MVSEGNGSPGPPDRPDVEPDYSIPLRYLAVCNNEHGYNAGKWSACPQCKTFDRIMVQTSWSPAILARRFLEAVRGLAGKQSASTLDSSPTEGKLGLEEASSTSFRPDPGSPFGGHGKARGQSDGGQDN